MAQHTPNAQTSSAVDVNSTSPRDTTNKHLRHATADSAPNAIGLNQKKDIAKKKVILKTHTEGSEDSGPVETEAMLGIHESDAASEVDLLPQQCLVQKCDPVLGQDIQET